MKKKMEDLVPGDVVEIRQYNRHPSEYRVDKVKTAGDMTVLHFINARGALYVNTWSRTREVTVKGHRHRIHVTSDGTTRFCTCGWEGGRKEDHPPLSMVDAALSV